MKIKDRQIVALRKRVSKQKVVCCMCRHLATEVVQGKPVCPQHLGMYHDPIDVAVVNSRLRARDVIKSVTKWGQHS